MTDHFSSPQWVDLVRGLLSEDLREEMDQHLRAGCEKCREAYAAWHGFAAFAEDESAFEPPRDAVRVSKTYLAQRNLIEGTGTAATSAKIARSVIKRSTRASPTHADASTIV